MVDLGDVSKMTNGFSNLLILISAYCFFLISDIVMQL